MDIKRTRDEIDEQMNRAVEHIDNGTSGVPGMSYEEGVNAALTWVTGYSNDEPIEAE